MTMFINGFPDGVTEDEIIECIEGQCQPKSIRVHKDRETGELRQPGKGWVEFNTTDELNQALTLTFVVKGKKVFTKKNVPRKFSQTILARN